MQRFFSNKKEFLFVFGLLVCFVLLHLLAIHQPYHQDEYKWPIIVNPELTPPGGIPHPPVGEFIYRQAGFLVGYENFRVVPMFFGFLNLVLFYYLLRFAFGKKTAMWGSAIFAFSFYSLLASLMVDTDGAIMPFFFLIMTIGYMKLRAKSFELRGGEWKWLIVLVVSAILGFLVKASFIIGVGALALDFMFEKGVFGDKKKVFKYAAIGVGLALLFVLLLLLSQIVFPYFRLEWTLKYWSHFVKFSGRGWMQTFIQFIKSCFYLSPFLVFMPLFLEKEDIKKVRPFILFITLGLFFYIVLFDFSEGALDRYFQFLVIPLSIISAVVLARNFELKTKYFLPPVIIGLGIYILQFFNHYVPSLHPKSEWVGRIISLKWNFLYPFSGGSGPLGFYVSFALIGLFWAVSFIFVSKKFFNKKHDQALTVGLLVFGVLYNTVFMHEYLFGFVNGYAPKLVRNAAAFIENNDDIKRVVVYNDNGGDEIKKTGKYEKRLYTSPQFDVVEKIKTMNEFSGHYLEVNVPPIDRSSIYRKYLDSCRIIYEEKDKYMYARVYDCREIKIVDF